MNQLSESAQNYLKAIYSLTRDGALATTNDLAGWLDIKPASVTSMIQKLAEADPPLVDYHKRQGASLTEAGSKAALEVIRGHRLLELFLMEVLGYSWDEVHEEAERLEHAITPALEARIAARLGHPSHDPHGAPIPDRALRMPERSGQWLADLEAGQHAVISRVADEDPSLLRYLAATGLVPEAEFEVLFEDPNTGGLTILIEGQDQLLAVKVAVGRHVRVSAIDLEPA